MIWIFVSLLLGGVATVGWGLRLGRFLGWEPRVLVLPEYGLIGLFAAAWIALSVNFFFPISEAVSLGFFALGFLFFIQDRLTVLTSLTKFHGVAGGLFALSIAVLAGRGEVHGDSGLYHLPSVIWLHESPIAFGLANLNSRIGFNSSWFSAISVFWLPGLDLTSVFACNALVFSFFLWSVFCRALTNEPSETRARVFATLLFLVFCVLNAGRVVLRSSGGSPTTDLPSAFFGYFSFLVALRMLKSGKEEKEFTSLWSVLVLSSAMAITVKLGLLPIAFLPIAYFLWKKKSLLSQKTKPIFKRTLVIVVLFILFWTLRGFLLTGCLAYPASGSCTFSLPWAVSTKLALNEYEWIKSFARNPYSTPDQVLGNTDWLSGWLKGFFNSHFIQGVFRIAALTFLMGIPMKLRVFNPMPWGLVLIALGGTLFWFTQAPDLRFGFTFVVSLPFLIAALMHEEEENRSSEPRIKWALNLLLVYFTFTSLYVAKGIKRDEIFGRWPKIPVSKSIETPNDTGLVLLFPDTGQCWDLPKFCSPYSNGKLKFHEVGAWPVFIGGHKL